MCCIRRLQIWYLCKYIVGSSQKLSPNQPMITLCCILILDFVSMHWKPSKGMQHAHTSQCKTNTILKNKYAKLDMEILYVNVLFRALLGWVSRWYLGQLLLCHFYPLLTPHQSTYPEVWLAIEMNSTGTKWRTNSSPIKGRPEIYSIPSMTVNIV